MKKTKKKQLYNNYYFLNLNQTTPNEDMKTNNFHTSFFIFSTTTEEIISIIQKTILKCAKGVLEIIGKIMK